MLFRFEVAGREFRHLWFATHVVRLEFVRGLVCEAFCKPNFNVKLVNIATNEVSTKGHHQPFLNPDASIYHVLFQWVPMYEPGEHLALTDGSVDGERPTVSSDSAAAGG